MRYLISKSWLVAIAFASACGGGGMFSISGQDSTPAEVRNVLARQAPAVGSTKPVVILAVKRSEIVGFDLLGKREMWRVPGRITTRIAVAGSVLAYGGESEIVVRSVDDGQVLWRTATSDELLGVATDGTYVAWASRRGSAHQLEVASAKTGKTLWSQETASRIGAPAVHRGQVFVPVLNQWLLVLDGRSGQRLARARGVDHQISFVRANRSGVTFGSRAGVYVFDESAAEARASGSRFAPATLPVEFDGAHFGYDAYDPTHAMYSAYDRNNRLLWRAKRSGSKPGFEADIIAAHIYRFLFAFDPAEGRLVWAYSHPRNDLVASDHLGAVIAVVSATGQIGALDPSTGRLRYLERVKGSVTGATFRAEGWAPAEDVRRIATPNTASALTSIARDRDRRFARVKKFALAALADLGDSQAVEDLIAVVTSEDIRPDVYESAVKALIARRDPAVLPLALKVLARRYDHVQGSEPKAVGILARVIAKLDAKAIEVRLREAATTALLGHLEDPATSGPDLADVVEALATIGTGPERPALRRFVVLHRSDGRTVGETKALRSACRVLASAGAADRAFVQFVAFDPLTHPEVAKDAREALSASSR